MKKNCLFGILCFLGFLFIMVAILALFVPWENPRLCVENSDVAMVFATLAGAVLVFGTIWLQHKSLEEDRERNRYDKFNTQFMALFEPFRMNAGKFAFLVDRIGKQQLNEEKIITYGENAFGYALIAYRMMFRYLKGENFEPYEYDVVRNEYETIVSNYPPEDQNDTLIIKNVDEKIKLFKARIQYPYLLSKYDIKKEDYEEYRGKEDKMVKEFILGKMKVYQPAAFGVYFQRAELINQLINGMPTDIKEDYSKQLMSSLGKEEKSLLEETIILK